MSVGVGTDVGTLGLGGIIVGTLLTWVAARWAGGWGEYADLAPLLAIPIAVCWVGGVVLLVEAVI